MQTENKSSAAKTVFIQTIKLLINAKLANDPNYEAAVNACAEDFAMRVDSAAALNKIEQVFSLDTSLKEEAKKFYEGFHSNHRQLSKRLIEYRELMNWNVKHKRYETACKFIIKQAEAMCNTLAQPELGNFIHWLKQGNSVAIKINTSSNGTEYLTTKYLLLAADLRYQCQTNPNLINEIKTLRDYDSHGYNINQENEVKPLLEKISKDWQNYQKSFDEFLEHLIGAFYSHQNNASR